MTMMTTTIMVVMIKKMEKKVRMGKKMTTMMMTMRMTMMMTMRIKLSLKISVMKKLKEMWRKTLVSTPKKQPANQINSLSKRQKTCWRYAKG